MPSAQPARPPEIITTAAMCTPIAKRRRHRRRVKTWCDGERTDGFGLKSRGIEYPDTVHFQVESTPVRPNPDEYQKQATSSPCGLASAVDLLQHYLDRYSEWTFSALRYDLKNPSTSLPAQ